MYYKLRHDVLFRKYEEYGLITDNSEYGYRMLNDSRPLLGEKFVSQSGAVMLSMIGREPISLEEIVDKLASVFVGVDKETLKQDTKEFLKYFCDEGYLSIGDTEEDCKDRSYDFSHESNQDNNVVPSTDDCEKNIIKSKDFLRSIHIEIANVCNERCVHCYIPHKDKVNAINSELFYKIIKEGRDMNIIHVTLSGGEPFLHSDLIGFLRECRRLDLSVNVLTNLTLLTDEILAEMVKNPLLSVQTSIYSLNPNVHDSITNMPGSLEKTLSGLKKVLDAKIPAQISCPVMKQNKDDFSSVIEWGKNNNISVAIEPVIFASYDHTGENLSNRLSLEEIGKAIDCQLNEGYADVINKTAIEKEGIGAEDPACSICRYSFCVSAMGTVYPCVGWQTNIVGDLNKQSLYEVWNSSKKIDELREIKKKDFPACVECADRGYCTVCMMSNSNENEDGDAFRINKFHCKVAEMKHKKLAAYR